MNYDTVEVIIDRVVRRHKLGEHLYDIEEMVEDIAEALKDIGAAKIYFDKVIDLKITNKMVRLPLDLQHIKGLIPSGQRYRESGRFLEIDLPDDTPIKLSYQAMPVDARGYVLVPDAVEVRNAMEWYLVKVLTLQGSITKVSYQLADSEWQWYCGQARAALNVWSVQDAAKAYNDFTRLNPVKDQHENDYKNIGQPNTSDRGKNFERFNRFTRT